MSDITARTLARIESVAILRKKYSNKEIAARLKISVRTVERYANLARQHAARLQTPSTVATWESHAACKGLAPATFFPAWYQANNPHVIAAKAICRSCPVLDQCREYALAHPWWTSDGIWAGMTPSERRRMRGTYQYEKSAA